MNEALNVGRLAFPRIVAGAVLYDEDSRVLLVRPSYAPGWTVPSGHPEAGETPSQACRREVAAQLGLHVSLGPLLVADWAPHPAEGDTVQLLFDGGSVGPEEEAGIRLDASGPAGAAEYVFCRLDDLGNLLRPKLARRVEAAIFARDHGRTLYLEHGLLSCPAAPVSRPAPQRS